MFEQWIALHNLPPEGRTYMVDNPAVWSEPLAAFEVEARVLTPLSCEVLLLPQDDGCLVRGRTRGRVAVPCNRCAEDAVVDIDHPFESFEPYPEDDGRSHPAGTHGHHPGEFFPVDTDELVMRLVRGAPEINLAGLAWEEFMLCLPVTPVCSDSCKGLCPVCGKNRNEDACDCATETADPRLAALKHLRIDKNKS